MRRGTKKAEDFDDLVRDALAHLYDPAYLQRHALAAHAGLEGSQRGAGQRPGEALRRELLAGIELLRPAESGGRGVAPGPAAERAERMYRALRLRYAEAKTPREVWEALGLGRSQYFRDQAHALEALAVVLAERWGRAGAEAGADRTAATDATDATDATNAGDVGDAATERAASAAGVPRALTTFIGRERELSTLLHYLMPHEGDGGGGAQPRLVTLTGSPGTGKTRLALEAALRLGDAPGGGQLWFVDLAPVSDAALVPRAILGAIGVGRAPGDAARSDWEILGERLRKGRALLILDNFEHVIEAAPHVAAMVGRAPNLRVLATSREALRVMGEQEVWVPPLGLPDEGPVGLDRSQSERGAVEELAGHDAVRLFVDRARAVRPEFALTAENAADVAEICRRLDGLPLALELAASRIRILTVHEIAERLGERLALLSHGPRDLPARQQTLRSAIGWSYDLLTDRERRLLRVLSVFSGGATLGAVEAVGGLDGAEALDGLDGLVAKSLAWREGGTGPARFRLLETVREFALEQLARLGEEEDVRRRHTEYFFGMVVPARVGLTPSEYGALYDALEREVGNLRAALRWSIERGGLGQLLEAVRNLTDVWWTRGYVAEGKRWLAAALEVGEQTDSRDRARALTALGVFSRASGDHTTAVRALEEAARMAGAVGETSEAGAAKRWLSKVLADLEDYERARAALEEGLALTRESGDERELARSLGDLGEFEVSWPGGDRGRALALQREAAAVLKEKGQGLSSHLGEAQVRVAQLLLAEGDVGGALASLRDTLPIYRGTRSRPGVVRWVATMAEAALALGRPEVAARLAGAVDSLGGDGRAWVSPLDRAAFERTLERLRERLGAGELARLRGEGRSFDEEGALGYALDGTR